MIPAVLLKRFRKTSWIAVMRVAESRIRLVHGLAVRPMTVSTGVMAAGMMQEQKVVNPPNRIIFRPQPNHLHPCIFLLLILRRVIRAISLPEIKWNTRNLDSEKWLKWKDR